MRAIKRWLKEVRDVPVGDPCLLAGRLIGLFDIRRQQWVRIDWLPKAIANCQGQAVAMLSHIEMGALVLSDLGYYNFEGVDTWTLRGIWPASGLSSNGSYAIQACLVELDGDSEARS